MLHSELKLGMKVKANKLSDEKYGYTREMYNCVGEVIKIFDDKFELRITEHTMPAEIGETYKVQAEYFDIVEENKGMKIELREVYNRLNFGHGDLLVFDTGKQALVITDTDGSDYRALILDEYRPTSYYACAKNNLLRKLKEESDLGELVRVVKAENLKLVEV